jgi:signal transduction histidine kinase
MQIRTRLTLQFLLLGGLIMLIASLAIYYSSANFRRNDFNNLLKSRAESVARLVLDSYEYNTNLNLRSGSGNPDRLQDEKFMIVTLDDNILYTTDKNWKPEEINTIIGQVRAGKDVFYKTYPYDILGTIHNTGSSEFVVIGAAIDKDGHLHMKKLRIVLMVVCLISLVSFFFAGWFFSGKALKPISVVVKKVEDISITSLHLRVPEGNGTDEIGRLAKTFNKMLERLETSFGTQKSFIANASHELRTPLTSINGQIEVLMMKDRTTEEYKNTLGSVLEDIKSLIDLSNRLILIARTSSEGPSGYNNIISIDEIIWQALEEMKRFHPSYDINISIDNSVTDSEKITVAGDEYLLKTAVSNLIENACKYSSDNSVLIGVGREDRYVKVIFEDKGIGIPEEDIQKILEPFYRGTNTVAIPGTGIGLSLVNQIVKNHNGIINITSKLGEGTRIILLLPALSSN